MPVIGNGPTAFGGVVSDNIYFEISSDACPQLTITCTGGGFAAIEVSSDFEEGSMLAGEFGDVVTATHTLPCEEYGWGAPTPDLAPHGNAFTCDGSPQNKHRNVYNPLIKSSKSILNKLRV
ncbi:hypothetical protein Aduo_019524 [Ancylostoma duodenale]